MNVVASSQRPTLIPNIVSSSGLKKKLSTSSNNTCGLSFYKTTPTSDIDLEQFEAYAIARLHVLRRIDVLRAQGSKPDELAAEVIKTDNIYLLSRKLNSVDADEKNSRDLISHYVLRLAYCRNEELRRWFLTNECQLFSIRFNASKTHEIDRFLEQNNLKYTPISDDEKLRLRTQLLAADGTISIARFATLEFYKIPFIEVLSLVGKRKVFVEAGYAYVSRDRISSMIEAKFRISLSKSLAIAYKYCGFICGGDGDDRIDPLIRNLSKIAYKYGGSMSMAAVGGNDSSNSEDTQSTIQIFTNYLTNVMGHTKPVLKDCGVTKKFVNVGTRKPNIRDRTCPIAGRVHKSNTQKYTIYFDTQVMMQSCWDSECAEKNRHMFYKIHEGKCVKCGWNPPPPVAEEQKREKRS